MTSTTEIPQLSLDFAFFREGRGTAMVPVLVMVDKDTACIFAYVLESKSSTLPSWIPRELQRCIQQLGYFGAIILKGDREPSLTAVLHHVARLRQAPTQIEHNAVGDSQSNGRVERAVQTVEMMTRTFKLDLENRMGHAVPVSCAMFSWLVRHAADTYNKFQPGRGGKNPISTMPWSGLWW